MTAILGISAFYHDSAAALIVDGKIVAAAQEERFSRKKHDPAFPSQAIEYCLAEVGLSPSEIDYVGYYDKPLLTFDRLLQTYLAYSPQGLRSFATAIPQWLTQKLQTRKVLRKGLQGEFNKQFVFTEHHESHAASAFFPSPFEEAAILTIDGVGEWATATIGVGHGQQIELIEELRFPHSLGLLYSAFTYYCGFKVNSGEYKLMGLAPYGVPTEADKIRQYLMDIKEDGSFRMDMSYFNYCQGLTMTSNKFHNLFGGPPRKPESEITQREMNLAASVQKVTEEIVLKMAGHARERTGLKNLCLAGGVALNCVANGKLLKSEIFDNIWIQPAAGDAGGALGTALFIWHQLLKKPREVDPVLPQSGSALGPTFSDEQVVEVLTRHGAKFKLAENEAALCEQTAAYLANGKVVGWMQGRMEFGPRALGNRSILGDPRNSTMQKQLNLKIKYRESFRPFAPVVLEDRVEEYFELTPEQGNPYMLVVADVQPARRKSSHQGATGIELLNEIRSDIPAVTHVDYSARVQTVDSQRNQLFHQLLTEFDNQTGCPVLINTSFNVRGEPIVCTPEEAFNCFMKTEMDVLVVGKAILLKTEQGE
ncbi:carbamoyltransferase [Planctomicrobium sp.]|jgi:carbamoyltransferase|nr:carbamoyltransferase [Planctomicrobium sp.]MDB4743142.1 carbamoyltransferase [Planctomicrobium sp.]